MSKDSTWCPMVDAGDAIWLVWKEGKPASTSDPHQTTPEEAFTSTRSQRARRAPGDWWRTDSLVYPSTIVHVVSAAQDRSVAQVKVYHDDGEFVAET